MCVVAWAQEFRLAAEFRYVARAAFEKVFLVIRRMDSQEYTKIAAATGAALRG